MRKNGLNRWRDEQEAKRLYSPVLEILFDELDVLGIPRTAQGGVDGGGLC